MSTRSATDVRVVAWEHAAAQHRINNLLAQTNAARQRDDLRAVRLLTAPLNDARRRYRATAEVLAAAADRALAGVS